MNQQEALEAKKGKPRPEKDRLKRLKTIIVFDRDALMDKEQRWPSVQELQGSKKRLSGDSF